MKLKRHEVKQYRETLLREQDYICPLCGTEIFEGEDTLDHDHRTGHVRRVLHRACNTAEGKILSWCSRSRAEIPTDLLCNILEYWGKDYSGNPVHPHHLTEQEKLIREYRRKLRASKRSRTKQKYKDLIAGVQAEIQNE